MKFLNTLSKIIKEIVEFLITSIRINSKKTARHSANTQPKPKAQKKPPKTKRPPRYDKTINFIAIRQQKIFSLKELDLVFKIWLLFSIAAGIFLFIIDKEGFMLSVAELMFGFGIFNSVTHQFEDRYSFRVIAIGGIAAGILRYIPMNCTASQKALTLLWVIFFTVIGVLIVQAYKVIIATREKSRRCRVPTNGTVVEVRQRLSYDETKFIKLCYTPVFKYSFDGKTYINDYYVCRSAYRQCPSRNSVVPLLINKRNPEDIFIKGYVNIAAKENFAFKISSAAACFCILTILIAIAIKI